MKLPKMTIRLMTIGVAVAAVPLGFWSRDLNARRRSLLGEAAYHARREREERRNLAEFDRGRRGGATNADDPSILKLEQASRLRVGFHDGLKQKYRGAADRPWSPVAPDPSDPGERLLWESLDPEPLAGDGFWKMTDVPEPFTVGGRSAKDLNFNK
jgi:hypothetical protein